MEISDARHCEIDMSQETGRERGREKEIARTNGGKRKGVRGKDDERRKKHWHALVPRGHESIRVRP